MERLQFQARVKSVSYDNFSDLNIRLELGRVMENGQEKIYNIALPSSPYSRYDEGELVSVIEPKGWFRRNLMGEYLYDGKRKVARVEVTRLQKPIAAI